MVGLYAVAVGRVLAWLRRILLSLFRHGGGEDTLAVALRVVNRALWVNWGLVCAMLDGEARRAGGLGAVLPSPQLMSMPQLRSLVESARVQGGGDVGERVARNVEWAVHTMTRRSVRRAATGDEGMSGEDLAALSRARREAALTALVEATAPAEGFDRVLSEDEAEWAWEAVREAEYAAEREADYYSDAEIDAILSGRDIAVKPGGQARAVRWARVIRGEYTCGFCIMLASRGAVYRTRKAAAVRRLSYGKGRDEFNSGVSMMDALDGSFHYHCDCEVVPVFDVNAWEGREEADRLYALWRQGPGSVDEFSKWIKKKYDSGWRPSGALSPLLPAGSEAA